MNALSFVLHSLTCNKLLLVNVCNRCIFCQPNRPWLLWTTHGIRRRYGAGFCVAYASVHWHICCSMTELSVNLSTWHQPMSRYWKKWKAYTEVGKVQNLPGGT